MRKLLAFLVWLFSFWTWKDFFLRWLGSAASHPASGETAEHLLSQQEGQRDSELARFLSSLPEDGRRCSYLHFLGDSEVHIYFGEEYSNRFTLLHGTGVEARYREFLEAVASSKIEFREQVVVDLHGVNSCKHVEAFADALRKCSNKFRQLRFLGEIGSPISFAKCVSSVLLGNDAIQDLSLFMDLDKEMSKELVVEFWAIIGVSHNLRILKLFVMNVEKLDGDGIQHLLKPFEVPRSELEHLGLHGLTSNAQLEHISSMLASNTSLESIWVDKKSTMVEKSFSRGYNSIAIALHSNHCLKRLACQISNDTELKVLLEPFIPKNNNLQRNTTLTKLSLFKSTLGKEGITTLVNLLCTNTSLLGLGLGDLSMHEAQGVENILAILEALKTNKSLKKISFKGCRAVGGYKVLGAMMDLLLENHTIQNIDLYDTELYASGDATYVTSALSKRKKMKLWGVV